jgi:hypothetical protein
VLRDIVDEGDYVPWATSARPSSLEQLDGSIFAQPDLLTVDFLTASLRQPDLIRRPSINVGLPDALHDSHAHSRFHDLHARKCIPPLNAQLENALLGFPPPTHRREAHPATGSDGSLLRGSQEMDKLKYELLKLNSDGLMRACEKANGLEWLNGHPKACPEASGFPLYLNSPLSAEFGVKEESVATVATMPCTWRAHSQREVMQGDSGFEGAWQYGRGIDEIMHAAQKQRCRGQQLWGVNMGASMDLSMASSGTVSAGCGGVSGMKRKRAEGVPHPVVCGQGGEGRCGERFRELNGSMYASSPRSPHS